MEVFVQLGLVSSIELLLVKYGFTKVYHHADYRGRVVWRHHIGLLITQ